MVLSPFYFENSGFNEIRPPVLMSKRNNYENALKWRFLKVSTAERKDLLSCPVLNKDANNYHHEWDLKAVSENKARKDSHLWGIQTHDLCHTGTMLYQTEFMAGRNENFNDVTT